MTTPQLSVNEFLEGSIEMNMSIVAHTIFWAIKNGLVSGKDDSNKLFDIALNENEINQLHEQNVLGVEQIKLFVIRTKKKDLFAFYFAPDLLAANSLHKSLFGDDFEGISNGKRLWANIMHFTKHDLNTNFLEYRKQFVEFPAYIGHAYARQNVCYYLWQGGLSA